MQSVLDSSPDHQHNECERHGAECEQPSPDPTRHTESRSDPDGGRRRQAFHVAAILVKNHAAANEADAGNDALNHAAGGIGVQLGVRASQVQSRDCHEGRPERHERVRPQTGWLLRDLTIEADHSANPRCGGKSDERFEQIGDHVG